ncbi:MAG: hypothetical protein Q9213_008124 [Squamulea squamosa]
MNKAPPGLNPTHLTIHITIRNIVPITMKGETYCESLSRTSSFRHEPQPARHARGAYMVVHAQNTISPARIARVVAMQTVIANADGTVYCFDAELTNDAVGLGRGYTPVRVARPGPITVVLIEGSRKSEWVSTIGVDEAVVVAGYNAVKGVEAWVANQDISRGHTRAGKEKR